MNDFMDEVAFWALSVLASLGIDFIGYNLLNIRGTVTMVIMAILAGAAGALLASYVARRR